MIRSFSARRRTLFSALLVGYLVVFLLFVTSCSASGTSASDTPQEEEAESATNQPNIIFILTDDLDYASAQKMPNLSSLLLDEGASFENAFISQSLCCPSRATILTGLYAHNHNVKGNRPPDGGFEKFRDEGLEEKTIAVRLQEAGYRTALFGKYLNGYPSDDPTHIPPGWDEWHGELENYEPYDYQINEYGEVVSYGSRTEDFFTDILSGEATNFVRSTATNSQPFFLYMAPTAPHEPAIPADRHKGAFADETAPRPPSFNEEDVSDKPSWIRESESLSDEEISEIDNFYQMRLESMLAVDEMVASLVEELKDAGKLENTFIFFTSDNGFLQGEHRLNKQKDRPYEESAHVPLFVRGPGIPAGSNVQRLVLNTDFAPTFADLAGGLDLPADGRSFKPLLYGEDPASWRSAVLLEGFVGKGARAYEAVRTATHKYVEYKNGEKELYDLETDPYELESLHKSADPSLIEDLKTKLDALRSCSEEGCREAEDAP
jgi:N-acetylglucosamine-6-sulfatase